MLLKFGDFTVDVDRDRTELFYKELKTTGECCSCRGCQNFDKAILRSPKEVMHFFDSLGIDPCKPAEACDAAGEILDDGTIYYWGFYHICGNLINAPECFRRGSPETQETADMQKDSMFYIGECKDFSFAFTDGVAMLEPGFPEPCIQLEFDMYLPCAVAGLYETKEPIKRI